MSELKQWWQALRENQSGLRIRDAAAQLGVSEAALLETRIGDGVERLAVRIDALCATLPHLGTVTSLIRNESAVHEKDVAFLEATRTGHEIRFAGDSFDLTLIPSSVAHAFYVEDANPKGQLRSVQLFDAAGAALWKIYARDKADHAAFERLLAELAWPAEVEAMPFARPAAVSPASAPAVRPIDLEAMLLAVAAEAIPVRLAAANLGVTQSHRGKLVRIVRMGSWLNVLDPGFDWHLNEKLLSGGSIAFGEDPHLSLQLAEGGEAARLEADAEATPAQRAAWRGILEKAAAS